MERQIRQVAIVLLIAFGALFIQLNYIQIFAAERIAANPANVRALLQQYSIKRGDIVTYDGVRIAHSRATHQKLKYVRTYPQGELYGQLTGYYSILYGADRLESSYNNELLGRNSTLSMQDIQDRFLGGGQQGDDLRLTINSKLQEAARAALGTNRGAIVAIEPQTGQVKAMWSNPSFDPNPLASHDSKTARRYFNSIKGACPTSRLCDLATSYGYPPGSTFKIVTATAALDTGKYNPHSKFPDPNPLILPQTPQTLTNFSHTACNGGQPIDFFTAITISCDTTFAILGLRIPADIHTYAQRFGFNSAIPFDIPTQPSSYPKVKSDNRPFQAYDAIGQGNTRATPLQMALVAATVANGGVEMRPQLVYQVIDPKGGIVRGYQPQDLGRVMSPKTSAELTQMMVSVVQKGTGTTAQIPGVQVAGKTGTAQTGVQGTNPHTWFICFAPATNPKIAVAVLVEHGGTFGSEATGGAVAAPLARQVLEADRRISGW
ncbi:MAG: penicillin-binding protein [Actinomycetota bacterium]|jgi:peptidoglycan glycosyltransferase|nr:penicillin-binding protein [Actinomycetota bacterium]